MKRRLTAAAILLLLFSYAAVLGAYNIHQCLSRQFSFSWRMSVCVWGLGDPSVRTWFLLLEGCAMLLVFWMAFSREYIKYKSKMIHVCLDIDTPAAEGQGQYGTAHWLAEKDKARVFTIVRMDLGSPMLRQLTAQGRGDLEGDL